MNALKVKIVNKSQWPDPAYATEASAGMDLRANITEPIVLKPLERVLVPTGIFIELPVGYDHKYTYSHFGYNLKVTDLQAAVGVEQLKKFSSFIERRKHNWARLHAALENVQDKIILPEPAENSDPSWFGFLISVRPETGLNRNDVTRYIEGKNVQTRLLFSGNIIKQPCFNEIRGTDAYRVVGNLENSDFVVNNTFWVGVYPGMTDVMIDYMAQVIKEAVEQ